MKLRFMGILLGICLANGYIFAQNEGQVYIEAWKNFYPSKALAQGMHASIFQYEDFTLERIDAWLAHNKKLHKALANPANPYRMANQIDARLLRIQTKSEIDKWEHEAPHAHTLSLYTNQINWAVESVLSANFLTKQEKISLLCERMESVQVLCKAATQNLQGATQEDVEEGLKSLEETEAFYRQELAERVKRMSEDVICTDFVVRSEETAQQLRVLIEFIEKKIQPKAITAKPVLGRGAYARKLALYTDSSLSPEELAGMALEEIELVRGLIDEVSKAYLMKQYPRRVLPTKSAALAQMALDKMEKDAPTNGADYLAFWQDLSESAIKFIEEQEIATLPKYQSLRILTAPESAGAAARIGWVESAPPFAPNPLTTLYLPSIPDTLPKQEQIDFWASFNKPFNRMIVIHELFPGHYMQIKISRESPHPVRLLFPYRLYFEGWATFTERVCLDAGWERDRPLTMLAHLRKRLENANRAYTSVQVHCSGWDQKKVIEFSTETSLLAPQFAKSLWGRLLRSPMQMTSYFVGGRKFADLLAAEKKRLGTAFELKEFMDTIMRVGPVPIDEFASIFK